VGRGTDPIRKMGAEFGGTHLGMRDQKEIIRDQFIFVGHEIFLDSYLFGRDCNSWVLKGERAG